MKITCDRKNDKLLLSHEMYIEKVLEMFNMSKTKPVRTPLANHFNLSSMQCPKSDKKKNEMKSVPYASTIGSLIYVMVCTRTDITYAIGVVSRYLSNLGKDHWVAVK